MRSTKSTLSAENVTTRIAAALLALITTVQTTAYLATAGPVPADGIGPILAAYRSVADLLPPHGRVGFFLGISKDQDFSTLNYYLAQQALAPRILSSDIDADTNIVITTTGAPPNLNTVPALKSFAVIGTGAGDIRVLRRKIRE